MHVLEEKRLETGEGDLFLLLCCWAPDAAGDPAGVLLPLPTLITSVPPAGAGVAEAGRYSKTVVGVAAERNRRKTAVFGRACSAFRFWRMPIYKHSKRSFSGGFTLIPSSRLRIFLYHQYLYTVSSLPARLPACIFACPAMLVSISAIGSDLIPYLHVDMCPCASVWVRLSAVYSYLGTKKDFVDKALDKSVVSTMPQTDQVRTRLARHLAVAAAAAAQAAVAAGGRDFFSCVEGASLWGGGGAGRAKLNKQQKKTPQKLIHTCFVCDYLHMRRGCSNVSLSLR